MADATAQTRAGLPATLPPITYPEELPVSRRRAEIAEAIRDHQVVVVSGETGSGKTTQLPKICLELGRGRAGMIGHTQPRRIAARTVADRVAEELDVPLGGLVGYQVRFTDQVSDSTMVKVMTDGILLAEIQRDPLLRRYDTIIVDEAHERSLTIDFILGYLVSLLAKRPDLKVVITSATIDSARFAAHFGRPGRPAPVVEVSGRTYPVEVRYRPLVVGLDDEPGEGAAQRDGAQADGRDALDQTTAICLAVDELVAQGPGDVLVFLSGEREIRDTADGLREHLGSRYAPPGARPSEVAPGAIEILPLYARLSAAEQHRVFERHPLRRVVLATNVAETSLTVPGIRYVVDTGNARISRYSNRTKVQRLPIEPVSRASADQRAGRCGRVADGVCIRLYSRADYEARPRFTEPEILRTSLASVILQMTALGLGEVADFPFLDPPDSRAVRDGLQLLTELGAIGPEAGARALTAVGRSLAQLPIDPRQGRMLVEADRLGCLREVMVIVAGLSVQDVRERPEEQRQAADEKHRRFAAPGSDFLSLLNLWEYLREQQRDLSSSAFRRLCRAEHLNWLRVREWQDVHEQLRRLAKPLGLRTNPHGTGEVDADAVHRALLAGLLSHIGAYDDTRRDYLGARGSRFVIFPGSTLAKRPPPWVMAAELVETSRLFARTVARIKPEWVEPLAGHLVRRTYSEPRWSGKRAAAIVSEKVLLYGIPLVADRAVLLGRVDPDLAREMFIRHALVEGDWRTHHRFAARNAELLEEAAELEHRARRRDIVVDADALFDFYDERLPETIVSGAHFDSWWKGARRRHPDLLDLTLEVLAPDAAGIDDAAFPAHWRQGDLVLPLTYQFAPGTDADGVTVHVPIAVLARLRPDGFDWMVPGLLPELAVATIKALPKSVRVQLVPAPDVARDVVARLPAWDDVAPAPAGAPSFQEAFAAVVRDLRGVVIPASAWDDERLPAHLRMTFRVVGERGQVVDEGKDLVVLQRRLATQAQDAVRAVVRSAVRAAARDAALNDIGGGSPNDVGGGSRNDVGGGSRGVAGSSDPGAEAGSDARALGSGTPASPASVLDRRGLTAFPPDLPGGQIPELVETRGAGGHLVRGYPALLDEPGAATVALRVLTSDAEAAVAHRAGVRRLLLLAVGLPVARVTSRWTGAQALALAASPYASTSRLVEDVQLAAITSLTRGEDLAAIRDDPAFQALARRVRLGLESEVHRLVGELVDVLAASRDLDAAVRASSSMSLLQTLTDVRAQHAALVHDGFLTSVPPERLPHLRRYLRAATRRIAKATEDPARDASLAWRVRQLEDALTAARAALASGPVEAGRLQRLEDARWLIEELRVSLFAQQLGTAEPVSEKRVAKLLATL